MQQAQNEMNIVILDRGLARMDAPTGTFIAYAAAPGQAAHDGASGTNGVFSSNGSWCRRSRPDTSGTG